MTKKEKKEKKEKYCPSCVDDFYNGNNPLSVEECWHLARSKVVWKDVYWNVHQIEPSKVRTLNCFTPKR